VDASSVTRVGASLEAGASVSPFERHPAKTMRRSTQITGRTTIRLIASSGYDPRDDDHLGSRGVGRKT
jgi:hypothetical protein